MTDDPEDDLQWLRYWVVLATVHMIELVIIVIINIPTIGIIVIINIPTIGIIVIINIVLIIIAIIVLAIQVVDPLVDFFPGYLLAKCAFLVWYIMILI